MTVKVMKSLIMPSPQEARFIELSSCRRGESAIADPASPRFADILTSAKKIAADKPSWRSSAIFRTPPKSR